MQEQHSTNSSPRKKASGSEFDIKEFIIKITRIWPLILLSILFALGIAWFYLRYKAVPMYHINAKVLVDDENGKPGGGSSSGISIDLGSLLGTKNSVDNEVGILQTRSLMEDLVRSHHLNIVWYVEGNIKDVQTFNSPFELDLVKADTMSAPLELSFEQISGSEYLLEISDEQTGDIKETRFSFGKQYHIDGLGMIIITRDQVNAVSKRYKIRIMGVDDAVESLMASLSAKLNNKLTTIIDLQLDYPLREKGEFILNNLIQTYIRRNIRDKSRIADSTIKFIDERIILVNDELNGIEGNIQKFMESKGLANISAQSQLLLESTSDISRQLAEIEARIEVLDAVEDLLSKPGSTSLISGSILNSTASQMDQAFNNLITSYNSLILERERLLLSNTDDNPYVTNAENRIQSIKSNIFEYLNNTKKSLQITRNELRKNAGLAKGNIRRVPSQERAWIDLSRQQQLKQELYLFLLQKREETAIANTSNIAGIRIIDPPKAEKYPYAPKGVLIFSLALLLGLFVPTSIVYARMLLDDKVHSKRDVEKRTTIPVIAELSHNDDGEELIKFEDSRSAIAEQFRALRTNLQFLIPESHQKVILITSSIPGEGKSFVSLNLANVYALSGKRVLLLEFDLRKPKLSKTYTGHSSIGISNFLIDKEMELVKMSVPVDKSGNLFFLPCGPIPPNPSELILNSRMNDLMQQARENFDIVIVDAPPLGAVTDAQLLNSYCDVALFVVRSNYTALELLSLPEDVRASGQIKNLAIIVNDIAMNTSAYYGAGYYGYAYGYYDSESSSPKQKSLFERWKPKTKR